MDDPSLREPKLVNRKHFSIGIAAIVAVAFVFVGAGIVFKGRAATGPSGVAVPIGDLPEMNGGHWHEIFADDFTVNSTTADGMNWKSLSDGSKIVYTGTNAVTGGSTQWTTYPETYTDTYQHRPYRSGDVLSTHDGVLDFYLHTVSGQPAGANPSPIIVGSSHYQTYGRYSARIKTDRADMTGYYAAWLLWPELDSSYQCAESDFPEAELKDLSGTNDIGNHHWGCSGSKDVVGGTRDFSTWHTYTQEWGPGYRRYYIDGVPLTLRYITPSTTISNPSNGTGDKVWGSQVNQDQRWQLQTETNNPDNNAFKEGHLLVDWVAVYSYSSQPLASPSPTPTPSLPTVPTSVTTTPGDSHVTMNWAAPSSNGGSAITGYRVTRETGDSVRPGSWTSTVSASTFSQDFGLLVNGTSYQFSVNAITANGEGPKAYVNATPAAATPTPSPTPTPTATPAPLIGDLNSDGKVNVFDLSILLTKWGTSDATSDINHDGTVNIFDLSTLLSHWTG